MPLEIPKIKEKTLGAKITVGIVLIFFAACVALFVWAAHTRYSYYQYLTRLEYVMGGGTSTVTVEDEEGNRCPLSETNRRAFIPTLPIRAGSGYSRFPAPRPERRFLFTR